MQPGRFQIVIALDPSGDFPTEEFDRGYFALLESHDGPRIVGQCLPSGFRLGCF